MPSVPQEITDMVIDILCDDPQTLASLTLTAQSWSPRSRKYLHKTLRIQHNDGLVFPAREVNRAKALLELPRLTELAQELVLDEYDSIRRGYRLEDVDDHDSNYGDFLGLIVERCVNLRFLTFGYIRWGSTYLKRDDFYWAPEQNKKWLCYAFPQIKSLTIKAGTFSSPDEFFTVLNTLPPLSRLTINAKMTGICQSLADSSYQPSTNAKLALTQLQELVIIDGRSAYNTVLPALADAFEQNAPRIHALELDNCNWNMGTMFEIPGPGPCVRRMIGSICTTLTTLRLCFHTFDAGAVYYFKCEGSNIELDRCTALKTIEFHFCKHSDRLGALIHSAWDVIRTLVQQGLPSSIRSMKIVCIPDMLNIGLFNFEDFEKALTQSVPSLEALIFEDALDPRKEVDMLHEWKMHLPAKFRSVVIHEAPRVLGYKEFRETIMAKLPSLAASGVLRVTSQMRMFS